MGALLTAIVLSFSVWAKDCDIRSICDQAKGRGQIYLPERESGGEKFSGGAKNREEIAAIDGCFEDPLGCDYRDPDRIDRLFAEAKRRLPQAYLKGRTKEQLRSSEKAVLDAIAKVGLVDLQEPKCFRSCQAGQSAGFLFGEGVCICPQAERYSDEFILLAIAHEMSHAGDICAFDGTGLKSGQHPLQHESGGTPSVIRCLQNRGIRGAGLEDAKKIEAVVSQSSLVERIFGRGEMHWVNKAKGDRDCYVNFGTSQLREAGADVVAFEVLADFLKDNPLRAKGVEEYFRVFGQFFYGACLEMRGTKKNDPGSRHASHVQRINDIAFSLPNMRKAMGCNPQPVGPSCEYRPPYQQEAKAPQGSATNK